MAAQSIQSFIGDLKAYKKNVLETRENAEISALTKLNELVQERVFTFNQGTKGESFGTYRSESYKKRREAKGRQTVNKDLEVDGTFRKSIKVGKNQGKNVLGFDNELSIKIREGQEKGSKTRNGLDVKQIGFEIFEPNNEEIDLAFEEYERVIFKKLDELANV